MTNEHFGQGNPHSDIWFIAKDANFPDEYLDVNEIGDDRLWRYVDNIEERYFFTTLEARLSPHPLFWGRLFHMKKFGRYVSGDGVKFWGELLGIEYMQEYTLNQSVFDLDNDTVNVRLKKGRSGYIYDLWINANMYLTETVSRRTSGQEIAHSKAHDKRALASLLIKYDPFIIVTLGGTAEKAYQRICQKEGLRHLHFTASHPSQRTQWDEDRLDMESLELKLSSEYGVGA